MRHAEKVLARSPDIDIFAFKLKESEEDRLEIRQAEENGGVGNGLRNRSNSGGGGGGHSPTLSPPVSSSSNNNNNNNNNNNIPLKPSSTKQIKLFRTFIGRIRSVTLLMHPGQHDKTNGSNNTVVHRSAGGRDVRCTMSDFSSSSSLLRFPSSSSSSFFPYSLSPGSHPSKFLSTSSFFPYSLSPGSHQSKFLSTSSLTLNHTTSTSTTTMGYWDWRDRNEWREEDERKEEIYFYFTSSSSLSRFPSSSSSSSSFFPYSLSPGSHPSNFLSTSSLTSNPTTSTTMTTVGLAFSRRSQEKNESSLLYAKHQDIRAVGIVFLQMLLDWDVMQRFGDVRSAVEGCGSMIPPSLQRHVLNMLIPPKKSNLSCLKLVSDIVDETQEHQHHQSYQYHHQQQQHQQQQLQLTPSKGVYIPGNHPHPNSHSHSNAEGSSCHLTRKRLSLQTLRIRTTWQLDLKIIISLITLRWRWPYQQGYITGQQQQPHHRYPQRSLDAAAVPLLPPPRPTSSTRCGTTHVIVHVMMSTRQLQV
ncbi:hypothetical protein K435DRAFT_873624 [Dendrothele bispora CBS 962.96]|uniref:Uncharacterized protein n=1 Tax=Dendrothele bispora (strain CBS 962.96) TaxID=1314807 RepID=A0A4S8KZ34_DENBC|nr:hypothetical protein K435DRAFT_873624 [Dendrothele bispora CBS 962.96]